MRAKVRLIVITSVILALMFPLFHLPGNALASSAGPDTVVLSPSTVNQAVLSSFSQDVVISYSHNTAGAYPKLVSMQYIVEFDTAVIDIDNSVCALSTDGSTYCGVTAGPYAQMFPIQELPQNNPCGQDFCANEQPVSGTMKEIFVASIGTLSPSSGVTSAGGTHSTIHWKIVATGSGTSSISFIPPDTFYSTSSTSAIDPSSAQIFYTPTNGFYSLNTPVPPIAAFKFPSGDQYTGVPYKNITLDGSASYDPDAPGGSPNNGVMNWTWSFGDGSPNITGTVPTISHNYTRVGTYNANLRVGDADQHLKSSWTRALVIIVPENLRPVAKFTWSIKNPSRYSPTKAFTNSTLFFDGSASGDPDGDHLRYTWSFGDGTSDVGFNVNNATHRYNSAGTYTVRLTVDEYLRNPGDNFSNSTSQTIAVAAGAALPVAPAAFTPLEIAGIGVAVAAVAGIAVYFVRRRRGGRGAERVPEEWAK